MIHFFVEQSKDPLVIIVKKQKKILKKTKTTYGSISNLVFLSFISKAGRRCLNPRWSWWWQEMILGTAREEIKGLWTASKLVGSPMSPFWSMQSQQSTQQTWPKGDFLTTFNFMQINMKIWYQSLSILHLNKVLQHRPVWHVSLL